MSFGRNKRQHSCNKDNYDFESPFFGLTLFPEVRSFAEAIAGRGFPDLDIREDAEGYTISVDVPGVAKKDITVKVDGSILTISGKRELVNDDKQVNVHRTERFTGEFSRQLDLGHIIDQKNVSAKFVDGVLDIHIKKTESANETTIDIDG